MNEEGVRKDDKEPGSKRNEQYRVKAQQIIKTIWVG